MRGALAAVALLTALRLVVAGQLGLAADEAYYWCWSERLAAGYFDHPPAIAWLIRAGTSLLGHSELAVRAPGLLLQALALVVLLVHRPRAAFWMLTAPMVLVGGMLATPDLPLLAAWTLGLVAADRGRPWLFGLCCGLAMSSKLSGWLLWPAVWLVWDKRDWRIYAAGAVALALASPNLAWNAGHGWVNFGFQAEHARAGEANPLEFLFGQALLVGPGVLLLPWLRLRRDVWTSALLLPLGFFLAASCVGRAEVNWGAPAWIGGLVLLSRLEGRRLLLSEAGASVGALVSIGAFAQALGVGLDLPRDPTAQLRMGAFLGPAVQAWGVEPVLTARYQEAAWIRFYGDVEATTVPDVGRRDQFDLWPRELSERALFVRERRGSPDLATDALYPERGSPGVVEARSDTRLLQSWQVFEVWGYDRSR